MSVLSSLAERLAGGDALFCSWCGLPDPMISGVLAREPFDAITLEMQHGQVDLITALRAIPLVAAAGKPSIVRIPVGEFQTASRVLDAGASAIIAPMINSVADAKKFVEFTKFPPIGERSWGPHSAVALSGLTPEDYFAQANGFTLTFAMIETREALAALDDILAVDGVDGVFLGPSDLSIALSDGARIDPFDRALDEPMARMVGRAHAAGKCAGAYAVTGERARDFASRGFDLIAVGSDSAFLRTAAKEALKVARGELAQPPVKPSREEVVGQASG